MNLLDESQVILKAFYKPVGVSFEKNIPRAQTRFHADKKDLIKAVKLHVWRAREK